MARVFVEMGDLETAVAVREAATADGHDVEMVESPGEIESRLRPGMEEMALVLTGGLDEMVASTIALALASVIVAPAMAVYTAVLYFDLRARRDVPEPPAPVTPPYDPYR